MEIRMKPIWGGAAVVGGFAQMINGMTSHSARGGAGLAFMLALLAGGVVMALLGAHLLVVAPIDVDDREVRLRNGWGTTTRRIPLRSFADVRVEGRELFVTASSGEHVKLVGPSNRWMLRRDDVSLLEQRVRDARPQP
jgi:hypothetical protein